MLNSDVFSVYAHRMGGNLPPRSSVIHASPTVILDYPWSSWKEYAFDSNSNTFCSTRAVFSRISKEDLRELVYTPVEGSEKILDIDTDCSKPVSDSEIKSFLVDSQGIVNPLMVQSLEKSRRNEVLRTMLSLGAGIRQLSRLTGVSFGVIQKLAK